MTRSSTVRAGRVLLALLLTFLPVLPVLAAGPPFEFFEEVSLDDTGHTSTFTDNTTGAAFKATTILVHNLSTSANEVYITAGTYTVTTLASSMRLAPGEWATIPPVWSALEPGRASIGLMCDTGETATVDVWGLR